MSPKLTKKFKFSAKISILEFDNAEAPITINDLKERFDKLIVNDTTSKKKMRRSPAVKASIKSASPLDKGKPNAKKTGGRSQSPIRRNQSPVRRSQSPVRRSK